MIEQHLNLLGLKVRDRVTKQEGVVTSVCFDLYGCIQAVVNPGVGKDGKLGDCTWFDVQRLEVLSRKPAMPRPTFTITPALNVSGPENKPLPHRI